MARLLRGEIPALGTHGGAREADQDDNVILKGQGNGSCYLAARIKRDFPDIAAKLADGEFPSVRAAAKAAGIIREPRVKRHGEPP